MAMGRVWVRLVLVERLDRFGNWDPTSLPCSCERTFETPHAWGLLCKTRVTVQVYFTQPSRNIEHILRGPNRGDRCE